jgi:regulator of protease activity HflC (stomatin/prohibitin superfamily)
MSEAMVVVLAILVFVVVTIAKGVRIVPQGEEWIVERLGKYYRDAQAGPQHHHSLSGQGGLQAGDQGHHPGCAGAGSHYPG